MSAPYEMPDVKTGPVRPKDVSLVVRVVQCYTQPLPLRKIFTFVRISRTIPFLVASQADF